MVDTILYFFINLLPYLLVIAALLTGIKAYLFINKRSSSWRLEDFFYFSHRAMETSYSQTGKKNKELQNRFSILILALLILTFAGLLLKHKVAP